MPRYENLYSISPAIFVAELEKEIDEIRHRQVELSAQLTSFRDLTDDIMDLKILNSGGMGSFSRRWHYDVRFPNYVLENLYAIEQTENGFKRWVGPASVLEIFLPLERSIQHIVEVNIVDFSDKNVEDNFKINIDGEEVPWLWISERSYRAVIPEDKRPERSKDTQISFGCSDLSRPLTMPENDRRILWFSISSITVRVFE